MLIVHTNNIRLNYCGWTVAAQRAATAYNLLSLKRRRVTLAVRRVSVCRGGTVVTVYGSNFYSVAKPRMIVRVNVTVGSNGSYTDTYYSAVHRFTSCFALYVSDRQDRRTDN